jgi:hypothetical protein
MWEPRRLVAAFALLLVTSIGVACTSSSSDASSSPSGCSTGAPYTNASFPPYQPNARGGTLPECVPRCGAGQKYQGVGVSSYGIESLPSGSCSNDGEACTMAAGTTQTCPGRATQSCNLSAFECSCANGTWSCVMTSQGAGICTPCTQPDGGSAL